MLRPILTFLALVSAIACPLQAQDTEFSETQSEVPQWQRELDEQPEVECDELQSPLSKEQLAELRTDPVTDESAFDCRADWAYVEDGLSKLLPQIREPGYGDYEPPDGIYLTIAARHFLIVYGAARTMRRVRCDFAENPEQLWNPTPIGGSARYVRFAGWTNEDDMAGDWQIELSSSDCAFFYDQMYGSDPEQIVHNKPYGLRDKIVLVSGHTFTEFLDTDGDYSIKIRPSVSELAGIKSELAEASQLQMIYYFTERARAESKRRELPESLREVEEEE